MKNRYPIYLPWVVAFLLAHSLLHAEPPAIFTGATLIDGSGQPPVENATLVMQDGRIVAAGKANAAPYAKQQGAKLIDCTGQTIMPALISDHSHLGVVKDGKVSSDNYTEKNIEAALMKKNRAGYIATLTLDEAQFIYAEHPTWMDTAAFRSAVEPDVRETWLTPEYASKIKRSPLTKLNKAALAQGLKNVKTLHDAGVLVGFGTDSGATPARLPGWAEHRELQLLVEAGLSPMEAIQCATRNAAEVLGELKNRGTLEAGKRADFLILDADPLADIRNTTRLASVYHGGKRIEPMFQEELSPRTSPRP